MGLQFDRGGVVAEDHDPESTKRGDTGQNPSDNLPVKILNGLDLALYVPFVSHLIGGLHVEKNEVAVPEEVKGLFRFPPVVGVGVSRRAIDRKNFKAGVDPGPFQEIDGRDNPPLIPYRQVRGFIAGAFPSPQSQMDVAAFFPCARRSRLMT